MKTEQIIILVVAFFLGMLLLNMVKNVCGCELKEGFSPQEANAAANKLSNACEWKPKTVSLFKQTLALGGCGVDFSLKNNLFQQDDVNELKNNFWCNDASELLDACSGCAGWREEGGANILNRGCSPDDSGGVGSLDAPRPDVDAPGPEDVDPGGGNSKDSNSKGSNNKDGSEGGVGEGGGGGGGGEDGSGAGSGGGPQEPWELTPAKQVPDGGGSAVLVPSLFLANYMATQGGTPVRINKLEHTTTGRAIKELYNDGTKLGYVPDDVQDSPTRSDCVPLTNDEITTAGNSILTARRACYIEDVCDHTAVWPN